MPSTLIYVELNFYLSQHVFQRQPSARCADERATRWDDGPVAASHPRLVPEQALQAQQEDERAENADGAGEGESSDLITRPTSGFH